MLLTRPRVVTIGARKMTSRAFGSGDLTVPGSDQLCPPPAATVGHGRRGSFHACLKPGNGNPAREQWRQKRVGLIRPDCELARAKCAGRIDFIVGFP